jgi:hypothetical protein
VLDVFKVGKDARADTDASADVKLPELVPAVSLAVCSPKLEPEGVQLASSASHGPR